MDKQTNQQPTITNKQQLMLSQIKDTPFCYATNGEKNYITCGKVIMETDKTAEEIAEDVKHYNWQAIGMYVQAIMYELTETNNNKNK